MKAFLNLFLLILFVSFFTSGCEKDNLTPDEDPMQPNKNALRISKMYDMYDNEIQNSYTFEYNSNGLVNRIADGFFIKTIEYDEQNRPVTVTRMETDRPESAQSTSIEWTDDGFIVFDDIYSLDSEDRIIRISKPDEHGTIIHTEEYTYTGDSKLTVNRKDESGTIYETWEIDFGSVYNPFMKFNVALTYLDYTVFPDDVPSHISEYAFSHHDVYTATYEVNEFNYPTKGTFIYSGDNSKEYMYYEYESN